MIEWLPDQIEALREQGPAAVLGALDEIKDRDEVWKRLVLLALAERGEVEYARRLAMRIDQGTEPFSREGRAAIACRLRLMERFGGDIGVAHTLLGDLDRDLYTTKRWPSVYGGQLLAFLMACVEHPESSVKGAALVSLRAAREVGALSSITFAARRALAEALTADAGWIADDEEKEDLRQVCEELNRAGGSEDPFVAPRVLNRVALEICDVMDEYEGASDDLTPLLEFLRERVLLDHAGSQALERNQAVQTMRIRRERASPKLVNALVLLADSVEGVGQATEPDDLEMPDSGVSMSWAPAASFTIHLSSANGADISEVFDVLERLSKVKGSGSNVDALVGALPPQVASAVLRLLARVKHHSCDVEITRTDPSSPLWQQTITIEADRVRNLSFRALARRARESSREIPVRITNRDVPQANEIEKVFQAVDAVLAGRKATVDDIEGIGSDRQVKYYLQAARLLGFLDEDNQATSRARSLVGISLEQRLAMTAVFFEDSTVGRAWRTWDGKDRLSAVEPESAQEFLEVCVIGLNPTTIKRRASTLRKWQTRLARYHPSR